MKSNVGHRLTIIACTLTALASACHGQQDRTPAKSEVELAQLGETRNVHACGNLFLAGQFTSEDMASIRKAGVERIISLRTEGEIEWNEQSVVEASGLEFVSVPVSGQAALTDAVFEKIRTLLRENATGTMLHCGSANRVGTVWLPYRVLDQGVPLEQARREAKTIGMRNADYEAKALDYVRRMQALDSPPRVASGINDRFLDPNLNVDSFVQRFEVESREVYAARQEVLMACGVLPSWSIADIGAGTGLYTRLFSERVGSNGWVYAVDIAPRFIEHINAHSNNVGLNNITGVLCRQDSCSLPPESVEFAFVCDTYHHFEFPAATTRSIYRALKPGGQLVVIDFERIPGKSRAWLLNHVRAGKDVFRQEIEDVGFIFVEEVLIAGFEENYFLRFRKPSNQ